MRGIALIAALTQGRNLLRRAEGKQMRDEREDFLGGEDESDLFILLRAFRFAEKNQLRSATVVRASESTRAQRAKRGSSGSSFCPSRAPKVSISRSAKPSPARSRAACSPDFPIK